MARSQVPAFGNWEGDESIPYSAYFDNVSKGKKSEQINQRDPQENFQIKPNAQKVSEAQFSNHRRRSSQEEGELRKSTDSQLHHNVMDYKPPVNASPKWQGRVQPGSGPESEASKARDVVRPRHDRRISREEGDMRKLTDSPLYHETKGRVNSSSSPRHSNGGSSAGDTPRKVSRKSLESDRSVEHSPLHPNSQGRVGGKGSGISSPSWERKATSQGNHSLAPSTPGRSRLRSVARGDETPDRTPAVPKFGEWDETDPASAEDYSQIFNRVREEKHSETGKVPVLPTETSYSNGHRQYENDHVKGCGCFPWAKR